MNSAKILVSLVVMICALLMLRPVHADTPLPEASETGFFSDSLQVDFNDRPRILQQTGQTVRKQYFMQIYAMAHYLEGVPLGESDSVYRSIITAPGIKQITMVFLRDLSAGQIRKSLSSGLRSNASEVRYESIRPDVERFMSAINADVRSNDEFILRWYPDGTIDSFYEGNRMSSIRNAEFAETMWSIWFGESSVVDRAALVERL